MLHEVDGLLAGIRAGVGLEHQGHTRFEPAYTVRGDDHANLARVQFHDAAYRVDPHALDELFHQFRVKVAIAPFIHLSERGVCRHARPVGAVAGNGVVAVDDGANRPEQPDLLPFQPTDVTAAVVTLVVAAHDLDGNGRDIAGLLHDLHAARDMALHDLEFPFIQGPGLVQDLIRYLHFAHVVQQGADTKRVEFLSFKAQMPTEGQSQNAYPQAMQRRVLVLFLELNKTDQGVRIADHTLRQRPDNFFCVERLDVFSKAYVLHDRVDKFPGSIMVFPDRADFLLKRRLVRINRPVPRPVGYFQQGVFKFFPLVAGLFGIGNLIRLAGMKMRDDIEGFREADIYVLAIVLESRDVVL